VTEASYVALAAAAYERRECRRQGRQQAVVRGQAVKFSGPPNSRHTAKTVQYRDLIVPEACDACKEELWVFRTLIPPCWKKWKYA
jgi:hypothetical protein